MGKTGNLGVILEVSRPRQWVKNVLVVIPAAISGTPATWDTVTKMVLLLVAFCGAASSAYIVNDIRDRAHDASHPQKSSRAVASGRLNPATAGVYATGFAAVALLAASAAGKAALTWTLVYLGWTLMYTFALKRVPVVDTFAVGTGFVLRLVAGAATISTSLPTWLLVLVFLSSLVVTTTKRVNDLRLEVSHHKTRNWYTTERMVNLRRVAIGASISTYFMSAFVDPFGHVWLNVACALIYSAALLRFVSVSNDNQRKAPEDIILDDKYMRLFAVLWTATILYTLLVVNNVWIR